MVLPLSQKSQANGPAALYCVLRTQVRSTCKKYISTSCTVKVKLRFIDLDRKVSPV